jgi:ABC-type transport system involved in multi-copper enzyme maturation permease subunit
MSRSVVRSLIVKDLRLQREAIIISMVGSALGLALLQIRTETAVIVGATWLFIPLMVLGCILPGVNVINERKKQSLAFLMSLPVSAGQYAMAKLISTIGMFVAPWALLFIAALTFILSRHDIPNGVIPAAVILFAFVLVGFCVIAGASLVSESEGMMMAAMILCNSSYGLGWYFIARLPAIHDGFSSRVAIWNSTVLSILGGEAAVVVVILGLTFFLQSRKRSFI